MKAAGFTVTAKKKKKKRRSGKKIAADNWSNISRTQSAPSGEQIRLTTKRTKSAPPGGRKKLQDTTADRISLQELM